MEIKVTNTSYPSLANKHSKLALNCTCTDCTYEQVFRVIFEYKRNRDDIAITEFKVFDKHEIEVSDQLTVGDFDKLMVEMQDWVACKDYWDNEPPKDTYDQVNR